MRLRLVYLPEQPARREVMIIYLECPAAGTAADPGASLLARLDRTVRLVR